MTLEDRPNPDDLLKAITKEESLEKKGKLKIFLGMAAGVGKTYAMLEEAQKLKKQGIDVVVGTVNTHGRHETSKLLEGLTVVPEKWIKYKDTVFEELDLDEILRLKPKVVLIDEFAHTNVPGSRHNKRWQDVKEILDNGIDVFTTLNVQHIESLKDIVENIAGIPIRETVPDSMIESAHQIELIDLTIDELLERLKAGKIYFGDKTEQAAKNFFQQDKLTALREVALRYAAEKVDHDLHGMISTVERKTGWRPRERLLVAVSHSLHSQKLIRTTRRLAATLSAPWIAVHVNDGITLSEEDQKILSANLSLARDLGAEVITTNDANIAAAIERIARQRGVTQIIIGRPPERKIYDFFFRYKLLDDLVAQATEIDIHVIRQARGSPHSFNLLKYFKVEEKLTSYFISFCLAVIFTVLNYALNEYFSYRLLGYFSLVALLSLLSFMFGPGPIILGTIVYLALWAILLTPQKEDSWSISSEDLGFVILYMLTALLIGYVISRSRKKNELLVKREESAQGLYEIARDIASISSFEEILKSVKLKLGSVLKGRVDILLKSDDTEDLFAKEPFNSWDEKEKMSALWSLDNNQEAGWSTTTLPASSHLFIPLKGFNETVGLLVFTPEESGKDLAFEDKNFLYTVGHLLANYIERSYSQERRYKIENLNQVEKVYQSLLTMLTSHFKTPLKVISEAVKDLKKEENHLGSRSFYRIEDYSESLSRMIENISALAKLKTGLESIHKEKKSIEEIIQVSVENLKKPLDGQVLQINIEDDLPLIECDFALMEILICNLILYSLENAVKTSKIRIECKRLNKNTLNLMISNSGTQKLEEVLGPDYKKMFDRMGSIENNVGLGLAAAKTIAEIHGGELRAENLSEGGIKFSIILPVN